MATKVTVNAEGKGAVVYCEVSGGADDTISTGGKTYSIGLDGAVVQFLTIKRKGPGDVVVRSEDGNIVLDVDAKLDAKKLKAGGTYKVPKKVTRIGVKEAVKK